MKKFTKVSLIICLAFACFGAVCLCAGIVLGSGPREVMEIVKREGIHIGNLHIGEDEVFFGENDSTEEAVEGMLVKQFDGDEIDSLDIDIKYGEVYLVTGKTDQIEIHIDAPKRNSYVCENIGGIMALEDETARGWWSSRGSNVTITISLPEKKTFREVEIATSAGKVNLYHSLVAENISLELDAGEMDASDLVAENELSADVGAGKLKISRFLAKSMEIECGVGEAELCGQLSDGGDVKCGMGNIMLELESEEDAYDYEMECGIGNITLNGRSFTSLGSEQEINHNTGKNIHLDCGMGAIAVTTK